MSATLTHNSYGKSQVRLTRVTRHADRHDLKELDVSIQLEGDFAASYLSGDNRQCIATDSMKNTVYVLAKRHGVNGVETFGQLLASHFLQEYRQVSCATIAIEEQPWQRIVVDGREHPHAFVGGGSERRLCSVVATRDALKVESGLDGLLVLKTTDSGWANFVRDQYTTLPDTHDRIFATVVSARWTCKTAGDWDATYGAVRRTILEVFATHKSDGVQQTLYAMGAAVLEGCKPIDEIKITMPNKHRIPMNLQPFGLDNANEVFVATDEPYGLISGTIRRS